jgi:ABC-type glycerol-3-phosphate transport system substrate-binding protein
MIDRFPYGKAPFWILVLALTSTLLVALTRKEHEEKRPDLIFAIFAAPHLESYKRLTPAFERKHNVKVSLQLVNLQALKTRLQNAMLANAEVPDLVEIVEGSMGYFTRGPLKDIGFVDLTERMEREGLREKFVESRFSLWSARGRIFGMPHDVHPVMLIYRSDIVESLGIDVDKLETWDDFVAMGRKVTKDADGDGIFDRYAIDLPVSGGFGLSIVLNQRGVALFDAQGKLAFNTDATVATMLWYIAQTRGKNRIAYECGWGQSLMKAMTDGLALFYIAPDWRSYVTQKEVPNLKGKMKLMPLPAWEKGGRRTSVWGGTGLSITKASKRKDLAWELAKTLYLDKQDLARRFADTNILPPFKDAWDMPEFQKPNAFYSNQPLGKMYAALAPSTPPVYATPYYELANGKLNEAFLRSAEYYDKNGTSGLEAYVHAQLDEAERYVQRIMDRNVLAAREE